MSPDFCRGSPGDCECEEYQAPENLGPGEKPLCIECGHGKSKHPKLTEIAASIPTHTTGNAEVLRIFKQASLGVKGNNLKSTTKINRQAAKAEAMEGYRPKVAEGSGKKDKGAKKVSAYLCCGIH